MKSHLARMLRAMLWADQQMLAAVRDCPSALPLLAHLLAAEQIWLARLQQREPQLTVWPALDLAGCQTAADENAAGYLAYLHALGENDLTTPVSYRNSRGEEFSTPVIDILTHVILHGAYHRGQIAKLRGAAGLQSVSTDYITFVRTEESDSPHR